MKSVITYAQALQDFLAAAPAPRAKETVPVLYAEGSVLAQDVVSSIDVPGFDNTAMDGYAVASHDLLAASAEHPVGLPVCERIPAGSVGVTLTPGACARIFTGAPMPAGADAIVPQEEVEVKDGLVYFHTPVKPGAWVRPRGRDVAAGSVVAAAGTRVTPALMGLIASVGCAYVEVYKHLRVAVFFTGSELSEPGEPLVKGGIYNSNRFTLRALLQREHCEVRDLGIIPDTQAKTEAALATAAKAADVIITCGGMSVGEEDHVKAAVEKLGKLELWRVALKPGKPVALGEVSGVPFIGLPGNPVSTYVTFLLLARPFLLRSAGLKDVSVKPVAARADFVWAKAGNREEFVRVRRNDRGGLDLFAFQNSQILTSCVWADGLVDIPAGQTIAQGDIVSYYPFADYLG